MPPVEDHPIHEKTRVGSDFRYGCFNHPPFSDGYWAPDRVYREDGTFLIRQKFIKRSSSDKCHFDQIMHPAYCEGCNHLNPIKEQNHE